jgi:hypothetical protein
MSVFDILNHVKDVFDGKISMSDSLGMLRDIYCDSMGDDDRLAVANKLEELGFPEEADYVRSWKRT